MSDPALAAPREEPIPGSVVATRRPASPRTGILVCALLALAAASYVKVIYGGFVWDDHPLIEQQDVVKHIASPKEYLFRSFWSNPLDGDQRSFYRPLTTFSYAVDYAIGHGSPLPFHIENVLLHLIACLLLFVFARQLGAAPVPAALGCVLFALAPRLTESVAWISGRTDVLSFVFAISTLTLFMRARARGGSYWPSALCVLGGLLAKETCIVVLPMIFVWEWLDGRGAWLSRIRRAIPYAVTCVAYAALRLVGTRSNHLSGYRLDGLRGLGSRSTAALEAAGRYLWMLLDPFQPRIQVGQLGVPSWGFVGLGAVVLVSALAGLWLLFRLRNATPLALCTGAAAALALTLHIIPIALSVVAADRFLYFPLAFLFVLLAVVVSRLPVQKRRSMYVLLGGLACAFAPITYSRVALWGDDVRLWKRALSESPAIDPLPVAELGSVYLDKFRIREAKGLFERAMSLEDSLGQALGRPADHGATESNLALSKQMLGQYAEAEQEFEHVAETHPLKFRVRFNLAMTFARSGDFTEARKILRELLGEKADPPLAKELLGRIDVAERRLAQARRLTGTAQLLAEARAWDDLGAVAAARELMKRILHAPDASPEELRHAAGFMAFKGERSDAEEALALLRSRGETSLVDTLGDVLAGRFGDAAGDT